MPPPTSKFDNSAMKRLLEEPNWQWVHTLAETDEPIGQQHVRMVPRTPPPPRVHAPAQPLSRCTPWMMPHAGGERRASAPKFGCTPPPPQPSTRPPGRQHHHAARLRRRLSARRRAGASAKTVGTTLCAHGIWGARACRRRSPRRPRRRSSGWRRGGPLIRPPPTPGRTLTVRASTGARAKRQRGRLRVAGVTR